MYIQYLDCHMGSEVTEDTMTIMLVVVDTTISSSSSSSPLVEEMVDLIELEKQE